MKALGLVVEYNPFHHGHYYHIQSSKEKTNADIVICVMSGYFLQRGEPAFMPRRERTKMALAGGADLVVELPYIFSSQHAGWFAQGAVSVLDSLFADVLSFGSEHGEIAPFMELQTFLEKHQYTYDKWIKHYTKEGCSYPKAAALAFQELGPAQSLPDLSQPNNILGYYYIKAITSLQSNMKVETIARTGSGYHETDISAHSIASATSIRRSLLKDNKPLEDVAPTIPLSTFSILQDYQEKGEFFYEWDKYYPYLQGKLAVMTVEELERHYEMEEGLQYRLKKAALQQESFTSFMKAVKTKRYTWTRIQRICTQLLTGTLKKEAAISLKSGRADHIRLLGMNEKGQAYLNLVKKKVDIPIHSQMTGDKTPQMKLNEKAARAYFQPLPPPGRIKCWQEDYRLPPVMPEN
ncbi:nucleotidyltransferase [Alteribacillus sp. HJP-4]|uniref:nucleotidyltransferase n=1 Tax=Alteribacillus sp. HJP-4 TaxID=2775394 RepID=UPI0035CCF2B9